MRVDKRRISTAAFKREAVHFVPAPGSAVAEAARHLGLNPHLLQRWKRELMEHEPGAFPGHGHVLPAQAERRQLQAENTRLRMERDILKQALGFFASESREDTPVSSSTRTPGRWRSGARCCLSVAAAFRRRPISQLPRGSNETTWPDWRGCKRFTRRLVTTDSQPRDPVAPNRLARQFEVETPDHVWVGDSTYVWTAEGWFYVAVRLDWYARQVVGWAMRAHLASALGQEALRMALGRRHPTRGRLPHADRGSQDAGYDDQRLLATYGIRCRRSRTGECVDHAVAERFFGSLTRERTKLRHDGTRQEARAEVVDDLEMFYHSKRLHAYLGYVSPHAYEVAAKVASLSVRFSLTTTATLS